MGDNQVFEDNIVIGFEVDVEHWSFIANQIHFFFNIALLNDDTLLCDWFGASVDAFD